MTTSRHNDDSFWDERGGGQGQGQGEGGQGQGQGMGGDEGGGHAKRSRKQQHPHHMMQFAPDSNGVPGAATTVVGQPRAPQPRQLDHGEPQPGSTEVGIKEETEEEAECYKQAEYYKEAEAKGEEEEEEEEEEVEEQREQHAQADCGRESFGLVRRPCPGALEPGGPARPRSPPGGYADNDVKRHSDADEEEEVQEEEKEAHETEEAPAQATDNYDKDGVAPAAARPTTSKFRGVSWEKSQGKWRARCKKILLGRHTKEEDAARAYNVEAERVGLPLNVIPPSGNTDDGSHSNVPAAAAAAAAAAPAVLSMAAAAHAHAGAGSKRAALTPPLAPPKTKQARLDTPMGAASAGAAAGAAAAAALAKAIAREAALEARIKVEKAKAEASEAKAILAEKQLAVHVAEQEAAEAERTAAALSA